MTRAIDILRRRLRSDDAFSIVEVIVAGLLVALSALAVMGLIDAASRNNFRATQSQVVNDRLQQEMEAIKRLPYNQVGLTAVPAEAESSSDPNSRVNGTQFNLNASSEPAYWNLVYNGGHSSETGATVSGGTIQPSSTFTVGNVSGKVFRYVVWKPNLACSNCAHQPNSDTYDGRQVPWFKQVVVAVSLDETASGGTRAYQEVQGEIGDPEASQGTGPGSDPSNNDENPWTFWLTDTPCEADGREPPVADPPGSRGHPTHNTLGTCAAGVKFGPPTPTGENAGAPDLMMTKPAPCGSEDCSAETLFDYANDLEPAEPDIGLQKVVPVNSFNGGCLTNITDASSLLTLGPDPQWYVHKWVSKPIPADSDEVVLSGSGALYLWTQTVNGGTYPGRICVWLFKRGLTGGGAPIDTLTVNTTSADSCDPDRAIGANQPYHQCSKTPSWHSGSWGELTVPLIFAGLTVEPDERIGLAIAVEREGTGGGGLQFMYDAPTYDTRLELNTKSALPF